jgi:hypothetical protein
MNVGGTGDAGPNPIFTGKNNGTGNDVWSARFDWTGLGLWIAGAVAVVDSYFDDNDGAIANSTSYSGYTSIKNLLGCFRRRRVSVIGAAAVSELVASFRHPPDLFEIPLQVCWSLFVG